MITMTPDEELAHLRRQRDELQTYNSAVLERARRAEVERDAALAHAGTLLAVVERVADRLTAEDGADVAVLVARVARERQAERQATRLRLIRELIRPRLRRALAAIARWRGVPMKPRRWAHARFAEGAGADCCDRAVPLADGRYACPVCGAVALACAATQTPRGGAPCALPAGHGDDHETGAGLHWSGGWGAAPLLVASPGIVTCPACMGHGCVLEVVLDEARHLSREATCSPGKVFPLGRCWRCSGVGWVRASAPEEAAP